MPIGTESLLIQAGIAGVFAAFVIIMTRETLKYLRHRDDLMISLTQQIASLASNIAILTQVVDAMRDCIQELPNAGKAGKKLESLPRTTPRGQVQGKRGADN